MIPRSPELVLSLFPGVGLLDRQFEAAGFCVVRGPDIVLDSRIEDFTSPPPGRINGIIGGPPCQEYSDANRNRDAAGGDRLVLEFLRVVHESKPDWFLMENVRRVPDVCVDGYAVQRIPITDNECGGKQSRLRHVQFGSFWGDMIRPKRPGYEGEVVPTITCRAQPGETYASRCDAMGVTELTLRSFTKSARDRAIGNGVPSPMGAALAVAVASRSPATPLDCVCGCGRVLTSSRGTHGTPSCRKRMQRRREGGAGRYATNRDRTCDGPGFKPLVFFAIRDPPAS